MASGTITRKEVITDEALKWGGKYAKNVKVAIDANEALKKSALSLFEVYKQLANVTTQKQFVETQKKITETSKKASTALANQNKALKNNQVVWKEQNQIEKNLISTKRRNLLVTEGTSRALISERESLRKSTLELKQNLTAMGRLTGLRNRARESVQNLNAKRALGNRLSDKEQSELIQSTAAMKKYGAAVIKIRTATGQFQENVGNYPQQLRAATGALRTFTSALGFTGGIFAFIQVFKNSIKIMKDFEKQNATLSGILQVNRDQMQGLTDDSKRLGAITVKTASEVTELQIAYARLGFSQSEIIDLTEATIQGSIALNANLAQTANLVGAIVNTFDDFSTIDAPEILDVLSLATAKSALTFEKLEKGLPIVAGAANAAGIPFTKLVALMGKLSDSGIDVSTSSTALRNIFIEAAKKGDDYGKILQTIKDSQDKLTAANDEFGKRAAVSAAVLSNNIDLTNELDESLQRSAGTAQSMADKELDTLDGALQLLRSAWQGIILEEDEANDITVTLKENIRLLAENLRPVITFVFRVVKAFVLYKLIMISVSLLTKAYTASIIALKFAKIALAGGIAKATKAMKLFSIVTKTSPVGILLGVLSAAAAIFVAFGVGAKEATEELSEFNDEAERTELRVNKLTKDIGEFAKGYDRLNIASDALQRGEDDLRKTLEDQGVNATKVRVAIGLLTSARGDDIASLDKQIDVAAQFTDGQKRFIRSAIINAQTLRGIIKTNSDFIIDEEERVTNEQKKINEKAQKKLRKDAFELAKFRVKNEIDSNEEISENEELSLNERLEFHRRSVFEGHKLLVLERDQAIATSKGGKDELLLIDEEFNEAREQLVKDSQKRVEAILKSEFDKLKENLDNVNAVRTESLNKLLTAREKQFQEEIANEELTQEERARIIAKFEQDIIDIKRKAAEETIKIQIGVVRTELLSANLSFEQRASLEQQLAALKLALSQTVTDGILADLETQREAEERLQAFKTTKIREASQTIASALNLDAQNLETLITGFVDGFDNALQGIGAAFSVLGDIQSSIFDSNIRKIDEQIEANDEFYDRQFELAEGDSVQQDAIRAEQEQKRTELEAKKREEQVRQAKFNKAIAATEIAINTAQAIVSIWAQVPKFDFGISAGLLTAFVSALGAAQIAAVLASPIPRFEKGVEGFKGGPAYVSEKRPEVIEEPNKNPYIVDRPSVLNLARGTTVHTSVDEYEKVKTAAIMANFEIQDRNLSIHESGETFDAYMSMINEQRKTRSSIEKLKLSVTNNQTPPPDINHELFRYNNLNWD